MQIIKRAVKSPEENISLDESLLLKAENGEIGETLRFWESSEYFVCLGKAGKEEEECFTERCKKDGIKILKRISGGGTVLQGPGCLNYSAVISYDRDKRFKNINDTYRIILGSAADSFKEKGREVEFLPVCDLAIDGKKISGNAQARKKKYFLLHGTVLYDFDINKISEYLKHPPKEPDYRKQRPHSDFVANILLRVDEIMETYQSVFLNN
jgi:lipoate-protein ligase A